MGIGHSLEWMHLLHITFFRGLFKHHRPNVTVVLFLKNIVLYVQLKIEAKSEPILLVSFLVYLMVTVFYIVQAFIVQIHVHVSWSKINWFNLIPHRLHGSELGTIGFS